MTQNAGYAAFHDRSINDRDAFWGEQAQRIEWKKPFDRVCNYDNPPFARWFEGGLTNLCHNAVDRHLKDRADQAALIDQAFGQHPARRRRGASRSLGRAVPRAVGRGQTGHAPGPPLTCPGRRQAALMRNHTA